MYLISDNQFPWVW